MSRPVRAGAASRLGDFTTDRRVLALIVMAALVGVGGAGAACCNSTAGVVDDVAGRTATDAGGGVAWQPPSRVPNSSVAHALSIAESPESDPITVPPALYW